MLFQQLECPPAPGPLPRSDFNLALLDEMLKEPRLKMVTCCAELSAG
jgi:TPP-dependent 2-oxoacid decarboxylase